MEACRAGVFAHGLAGVLQEERQGGPSGATAIDIIAAVGEQ